MALEEIFGLAINRAGDWFLAHGGGLARSGDGGKSWRDAYGELFGGAAMPTTALAYEPATGALLGGAPGGILASADGENWQVTRLPEPAPMVVGLAFSPNFGADGTAFAASAEDGLFCTHDGGLHWTAWNFGLLDANLFCLAVSPDYARERTLWVGSSSGIFRSTNGGYSWTALDFPGEDEEILCLAALEGGLLAGGGQCGLLRSEDGGVSWRTAAGLPEAPTQLVTDRSAPRRVCALCAGEVYVSEDGGVSFSPLAGQKGAASALFALGGKLFAACENGLWQGI